MTVKPTPVFVQTPKVNRVTIVNADTTTKKTLVTAGGDGTKVVGIQLTSDDTSARLVQIFTNRSATSILLGTVNVPTLAGTDGSTPAVNALSTTMLPGLPRDADGQPYINLESGDTLEIATTTTVTSGKTVTAHAVFGNF